MSNLRFRAFDKLVNDEEKRAQAARSLRIAAKSYPDMFEKFARKFLEELEAAPERADGTSHSTVKRSSGGKRGESAKPTPAILAWLAERGEGTSRQAVEALLARVETDSDNPKSIIYSTLGSLERRKLVTSRKTGEGEKVFRLTPLGQNKATKQKGED